MNGYYIGSDLHYTGSIETTPVVIFDGYGNRLGRRFAIETENDMSKALIVGGGIGGLATAIAFDRRGWEVEILEKATKITAVGAGLSLWPNAIRALDALGLGDEVQAAPSRMARPGFGTAEAPGCPARMPKRCGHVTAARS